MKHKQALHLKSSKNNNNNEPSSLNSSLFYENLDTEDSL